MRNKCIDIPNEEAGLRLDRWLKKHFGGLSFSVIQKWVRTGQVRVNGKRVEGQTRLASGDEIRLPPFSEPLLEKISSKRNFFSASPADLQQIEESILFENPDILVLNKPAGWAVQGGTGTEKHLDGFWKSAVEKGFRGLSNPPKIVHRLDKNTTGTLLFAKNYSMAKTLAQAFKEHAIQKTYHAVSVACPDPLTGTIQASLLKNLSNQYEKIRIDPDRGKKAITHYRVLKTYPLGLALLELSPETGRTHQLRVHCASLQTPILGDGKYGGKKSHPFSKRSPLMLHAHSLTLPPSLGGETFIAPYPLFFTQILHSLEKEEKF